MGDTGGRFGDIPPSQRRVLDVVWKSLVRCVPGATVTRKYGIDCIALDGVIVGGLAGYRHHNSYFPFSGGVVSRIGRLPRGCSSSQGTLRFPLDQPLAPTVVRRLVRLRLAEMAAVDHGRRIVTFPNGALKAVGPMRRGKLHGAWSWYRQDGSLMRTGSFRDGSATGAWRTYDRAGRVISEENKGSTTARRVVRESTRPAPRASRSRAKSPRRSSARRVDSHRQTR